jgi:hypothetical protein
MAARGGGPIGSAASVGWAKRRSFSSQRRLGLPDSLVEEVSAIAGPVVEWSANRRNDLGKTELDHADDLSDDTDEGRCPVIHPPS